MSRGSEKMARNGARSAQSAELLAGSRERMGTQSESMIPQTAQRSREPISQSVEQ